MEFCLTDREAQLKASPLRRKQLVLEVEPMKEETKDANDPGPYHLVSSGPKLRVGRPLRGIQASDSVVARNIRASAQGPRRVLAPLDLRGQVVARREAVRGRVLEGEVRRGEGDAEVRGAGRLRNARACSTAAPRSQAGASLLPAIKTHDGDDASSRFSAANNVAAYTGPTPGRTRKEATRTPTIPPAVLIA